MNDETRARRRELDRSVVSGIAWTGGMRSLTQTVQWVAALLVVRLLTPADYGLVAMSAAYLGLVRMFSEFGLGAAIIQRRNLSTDQIAQLGGVSLLFGTFFAVVSVALSGLIAGFFQEPQVRPIIMVLSITFVFTGVDVVARSLLRRDLQFKRLALVHAFQNFTYALTSLTLAALGFGYWSLVYAGLAGQCVRMVAAVSSRRHPIAWPRDVAAIRSELWFGGHVVVSNFALYVRRFSDILIVGQIFGTELLGAYNVAWTQANIPVERVTPLVTGVSASVLAAAQNDQPELRRYVQMFTEGIALVAFPAAFGLAVVADDFIMLVFGERWVETIGPLRVLAVVATMRSITPILSQTLIATGNAKKNMQFAVAGAVLIPALLYAGSNWGITGVAFGWLIGHPLIVGSVLLRHALKAASLRLGAYLQTLVPALLCSVALVLAVIGARMAMPPSWPLTARFGAEVAVGSGVYGVLITLVYRARLRTFISLLRPAGRSPSAAPSTEDHVPAAVDDP